MNERLAKAEALFHEALELPPEQREGFLQQACGEDAELFREVAALLRASGVADRWLRETVCESPKEVLGTMIGRYKLLETLGEGGCGVVWLAEQREPVRRKVALKIIKLGMDTRSVVARFEAERQALALMDHPNIAKVFDAGTTDTGRPYFVMELVRGIPITKFCDENKLATGERLDLFIKVCQAVQHAHQKGIIHRDLKPSNILITLHDGVPVPKVIDFGIAKATQQELTDKTIHTLFQQFIGTPAYMSPEQAEMSGLDIDTRSDIYSLGVLLYELLTGVTPFDAQTLVQSGLDEMRRIIREEEPKRPSTRLSTLEMTDAAALTKHRQEKLPALVNLVRGDLDWIVMKCLEKDRQRRYDTANGLAADLKRHLGNEPVIARPPNTAYRVQKFVRRNKAGVVAAALVLLLLVAGVVGTSLGLVRADRERGKAVNAAARATAASTEAQKARGLAEDNARKLEENLYYNSVALAHRELTAEPPNIWYAERLLEACPPTMRNWEWHYLKRLRLTEPMTLRDAGSKEAYSIAYSPDGRHLASACGDGKVRIWNLATAQLEQTLAAHTNFAFCVAFHPTDATRLASAGADRRIKLWDWKTGTELHSWPGHLVVEVAAAYSVAFSPDGRHLAAPGEEGVANVWDTKTFANARTLSGHKRLVSVAFSPDGKWLAAGSGHGIVRLWDAATGQLQRELDSGGPLSCVTFRHDSRQLACTDMLYGRVRIWDMDSSDRKPRLYVSALNMGVAFSADGQRLAAIGYDGQGGLWEAASGRQVLVFRELGASGTCVRFSPDGNRLAASGSDGSVRVWDATPLAGAGDQSLLTLRVPGGISAMYINSTSSWFACAGISSNDVKGVPIQIWETGRDRLTRTLTGHSEFVLSLAFDPTGKFLAASGDDSSRLPNLPVKVWDLATGAEAFPVDQFEEGGLVYTIAYSKDGKRLVGAGGDGRLKVWEARTGRRVGILGEHKREINTVTFSPDGKHLASAGADNTVKLWDATRLDERQENPATFEARRIDLWMGVAFSPDSARLVFARDDHAAQIWDIVTRKVLVVLESRAHQFFTLAFSPDGRWVASGGDDSVKLWDAQTGRLRHTFRGHTRGPGLLAFVHLPEGSRLVSASFEGTVKYWDMTPFGR